MEIIGWLLLGGAIGCAIGQKKGRAVGGTIVGAILGPLGWLLVAVGPDERPKCPQCRGAVPTDARKCLHCGSDLVIRINPEPKPEPTVRLRMPARRLETEDPEIIRMECPMCGQHAESPVLMRGSEIECPGCQKRIVIPA